MRKNNWRLFQNIVNSVKSSHHGQEQTWANMMFNNSALSNTLLAAACITLSILILKVLK